jgi:hypothetical protein
MQIEPPLPNAALEVDGTNLTLRGIFQPGTRYQVTIPASAVDAEHGIELGSDIVWSFTVGEQYPNFSILNRDRVMRLPANEPLTIPTQFTNISRLDIALEPITRQQFQENAAAPFEAWAAFRPAAAPMVKTNVLTHAQLDRYHQLPVSLPPLAPGAYLLEISTPEGLSDRQLLEVGTE